MADTSTMENTVAEALRNQIPVRALPGVSIANVQEQPEQPFDISFDLLSGPNQIRVLGEVKPTFSPRVLEEIGPWIRRLKSSAYGCSCCSDCAAIVVPGTDVLH